jgi:hypothetical protein
MAAGLKNVMAELQAPLDKSPYGVAAFEALQRLTEGLRKRAGQLARAHRDQDGARRRLQEGSAEEARLLAGLRVYLDPQDQDKGARVRALGRGGRGGRRQPRAHKFVDGRAPPAAATRTGRATTDPPTLPC